MVRVYSRPPSGGRWLVMCAVVFAAPRLAAACEAHTIFTATQLMQGITGPYVGLAEQYSALRDVRDGDASVDPRGERMDAAITQVVAGWNFTDALGAQLTLPIIVRDYRRREHGRLVDGSESGIGDMSLLGRWQAIGHVDAERRWSIRFSLLGGLELPTGDPSRLADERLPVAAAVRRVRTRHTTNAGPLHGDGDGDGEDGDESAIHSHDLALGSGSVDGIVGGQLFWSWRRAFVTATLQWALRTDGAHGYHFANTLGWSGGVGWFVATRPELSLAPMVALSGETKGKDTQDGRRLDDTGLTTMYVGPGMLLAWGTHLGAEAAVDLPVVRHTTALQIVPTVRVRAGLTWRF